MLGSMFSSLIRGRDLDAVGKRARDMAMRQAAADDQVVKSLLKRWVSECPPAVAMQHGKILGLTIAGRPIGSPMFIVIPVEESDYANS